MFPSRETADGGDPVWDLYLQEVEDTRPRLVAGERQRSCHRDWPVGNTNLQRRRTFVFPTRRSGFAFVFERTDPSCSEVPAILAPLPMRFSPVDRRKPLVNTRLQAFLVLR